MAAIAVSSQKKRRLNVRKNAALSFINSIESGWKGHEPFAFWLIETLKPKTIVDLGFDKGLSTVAFAYRNRGHVFGVNWFDEGDYATKCFALDSAFRNISSAVRFQYAKNIHLIVGPFHEISKTWTRKIDILHIDLAHQYSSVKTHYNNWSRYLEENGIVLVHDVRAFPNETGRFFDELPLPKIIFSHSHGLGVATKNEELLEQIKKKFF